MDFFKIINFLFSSVFNPKKIWKQDNVILNYPKKYFIILSIITFFVIFLIYFYFFFSILSLTSIRVKFLSIALHLGFDFLFAVLIFYSVKLMLFIFHCNVFSNRKLFIGLYVSAIPIFFTLIIYRVFPEVFFLAIVGLWSFVLLYYVYKYFFLIEKKILTLFYLLSCLIIISFYSVFLLIIYYVLTSL